MSTTVAFLAETPGSATIDAQKACLGPDDTVVIGGRIGFHQLAERLASKGIHLGAGDRVKVFDFTCISLATTTLIRALSKLLEAGVSIELVAPGIVIEPAGDDQLFALLAALNRHSRHQHGIKTHPAEMAQKGRKRLLDEAQYIAIRTMLDMPGATATEVAQELGVARSTLFNYLERYGRDRRVGGGDQAEQRSAEDAGDDGHVVKRKTRQTSA